MSNAAPSLFFQYDMTRECYISAFEYLLMEQRKRWPAVAQFLLFTAVQMIICAVIVFADGSITGSDWPIILLSVAVCAVQLILRYAVRYKAGLTCRQLEARGQLLPEMWGRHTFHLQGDTVCFAYGKERTAYPVRSVLRVVPFKNIRLLVFKGGAIEVIPQDAGPENLEALLCHPADVYTEEASLPEADIAAKLVLWTTQADYAAAQVTAVRQRYRNAEYWKQHYLRRVVVSVLATVALLFTKSSALACILGVTAVLLNIEHLCILSPLLRIWANAVAKSFFTMFPPETTSACMTGDGIGFYSAESTLRIPWCEMTGWHQQEKAFVIYLRNSSILAFTAAADTAEAVCANLQTHITKNSFHEL